MALALEDAQRSGVQPSTIGTSSALKDTDPSKPSPASSIGKTFGTPKTNWNSNIWGNSLGGGFGDTAIDKSQRRVDHKGRDPNPELPIEGKTGSGSLLSTSESDDAPLSEKAINSLNLQSFSPNGTDQTPGSKEHSPYGHFSHSSVSVVPQRPAHSAHASFHSDSHDAGPRYTGSQSDLISGVGKLQVQDEAYYNFNPNVVAQRLSYHSSTSSARTTEALLHNVLAISPVTCIIFTPLEGHRYLMASSVHLLEAALPGNYQMGKQNFRSESFVAYNKNSKNT
ncbi:predicted protein [Histoplasma mississippiense (nom. inval.)]|uniref:predicted protein n=1 Tax=Ajellomyces capsulatus (strain NAm1 / WU24) TaxID=2059318 RepID=UPI000157C731|nr:predicted protein [Histoplasma mississippiense (nom. inval.)]EDN08656.1 predicted protein [Histoplasma mississippiense (nom. inval.)]